MINLSARRPWRPLLTLFLLFTLSALTLLLVEGRPLDQPSTAVTPTTVIKITTQERSQLMDLTVQHRFDYQTFSWLVVEQAELAELQRRGIPYQVQPEPYHLTLGEYRFDPRQEQPQLPAGWTQRVGSQADLHLVQFYGPTQQSWLTQLQASGLEIVQYIHPFTYVVWGDEAALAEAGRGTAVRWTGAFHPAYRVLPHWRQLPAEPIPVKLYLYPGADLPALHQALAALAEQIDSDFSFLNDTAAVIGLTLPGDRLQQAAQIPGVYTVQPLASDGGLRSEMSNQINVNNHDGTNTAFPGYLAWLAQAGVDGSGVIMANVDGGVQETHPDLVNRFLPCNGSTCGGGSSSSHGTHTAGIMGGDGSSGVTANGFLRGLGMAPGANMVEQLYFSYPDPDGLLNLMIESYDNGAILSGNSWGPAGSPQGYDGDTKQVDIGARDADPNTAGNQEFLYVLSFMNGGGGTSSQGSPDEAKNIFTIGSTKMQTSGGSQILAINDISSNSAHGPALDGRTIPHMVAPGCYVDSSEPTNSYGLKCGTSMASPHVTGAAALFIEYYRQLPLTVRAAGDPSPALVKAAFLPVAHDLAGHLDADGGVLGHYFDNKQGWGRMDTAAVVSPTLSVRYFDAPLIFDNSGEMWSQSVSAADPSEPIRIMLVWTDAPGHGLGGSTPAWNNDLDLVVQVGNDTYYGNDFDGNGWSQPGGTPDDRNNTEGVYLNGPTSANIQVMAANINSDGVPQQGDGTDQDFAIVCYNCATGPDFALSVNPAAQSICPGAEAIYEVDLQALFGFNSTVTLAVQGEPAGTTAVLGQTTLTPPATTPLSVTNTSGVTPGNYTFFVSGAGPTTTHTTTVGLEIATVPASITLIEPLDGAIEVSLEPTFSWQAAADADQYTLELATDLTFNNIIYTTTLSQTSHMLPTTLNGGTSYFWRVYGTNSCGPGLYSAAYSFETVGQSMQPKLYLPFVIQQE